MFRIDQMNYEKTGDRLFVPYLSIENLLTAKRQIGPIVKQMIETSHDLDYKGAKDCS